MSGDTIRNRVRDQQSRFSEGYVIPVRLSKVEGDELSHLAATLKIPRAALTQAAIRALLDEYRNPTCTCTTATKAATSMNDSRHPYRAVITATLSDDSTMWNLELACGHVVNRNLNDVVGGDGPARVRCETCPAEGTP